LGEATRKTKQILLVANVALAALLVPLGIVLSRRMLKHGEAFQRALKRSEERFNLAVNGSNDGIWDWHIQSNEIYYSTRCKELLGYAGDEIQDTWAIESRLHPDDLDMTFAHAPT
jgi:PAS domain-containing protein